MRERLVAVLAGTTLALVLACAWLGRELARTRGARPIVGPEVLRAMAGELARASDAAYDAHPDPDVGRVLLPGRAGGQVAGVDLATNAMGMREAAYELPKPPGTLRVVLLGDSFVFGWRVAAEERLGARLAELLRERLGATPPAIECLHLAVPSWNLTTECAWLARQLDRLRPDLVLHVTVSNDLDDTSGVRGFGVPAGFAPAHRERANGFVTADHPSLAMGFGGSSYLPLVLDGEGAARARDAGDRVLRLADALAALDPPAGYVLIAGWGPLLPVFHRTIGSRLPEARRLYLPASFQSDPALVLDAADVHWSPAGHERMARLCYALIVERGLLPGRPLAPWPEAEQELRALAAAGAAEAREPLAAPYALGLEKIRDTLDLREVELAEALQIHGGVDREGLVAPYASLVLRRGEARALELDGRALPDAHVAGARVRVWLDEVEVATLTLAPDEPIRLRARVPAALDGRAFLALRLETDEWVYRGDDLRRCTAWRLERAALAP